MISYSSGVNRVFIHRVRLLGIFLILILIIIRLWRLIDATQPTLEGAAKKLFVTQTYILLIAENDAIYLQRSFDFKGSSTSICFGDMVVFFAFATSNPKPSLASS